MSVVEPILPLAVSLALGLLIGLERGWHEREAGEGRRVAGVRTYGLIGLLGGFAGLLASETHHAVLGYAFVGVAAALVTGYVLSARQSGDLGITSVVAGLLTFAFGAAATVGYMAEAAMVAVVTGLLLGYKSLIHRLVSALEPDELHATLKLLAISVVVLPILPNRGFGPWEALNPFEVWWMVVLIAGISFSGYFAMKIVGTGKGAIITGFLAGLASSTALTLHFSRLARSRPSSSGILAAAILFACGMMFPRMLVVASIVHWEIFRALLVPVMAMGAILYLSATLLWWLVGHSEVEGDQARLKNPLQLGSAVMFGGLLALVMLAANGLGAAFGDSGIAALAGISGITDVDAITLTLSKMSRSDIAIELAAFGIILAGAVNSVVKGVMTAVVGGTALGARVAIPLMIAAGAGLLLAWTMGGLSELGRADP